MFSMIYILGAFVVFLRGEVETRSYYVALCLEIIEIGLVANSEGSASLPPEFWD